MARTLEEIDADLADLDARAGALEAERIEAVAQARLAAMPTSIDADLRRAFKNALADAEPGTWGQREVSLGNGITLTVRVKLPPERP